jgi:hypothetical protein
MILFEISKSKIIGRTRKHGYSEIFISGSWVIQSSGDYICDFLNQPYFNARPVSLIQP